MSKKQSVSEETSSTKLNNSHVYVISRIPNEVKFFTKRTFSERTDIAGNHYIDKQPEEIVAITGTHTRRNEKMTEPYRLNVIKADVWEMVLAHNSHCNYFKNGNIQWFNTQYEAIAAGSIEEFKSYTGLERIDPAKLSADTNVQHRPI